MPSWPKVFDPHVQKRWSSVRHAVWLRPRETRHTVLLLKNGSGIGTTTDPWTARPRPSLPCADLPHMNSFPVSVRAAVESLAHTIIIVDIFAIVCTFFGFMVLSSQRVYSRPCPSRPSTPLPYVMMYPSPWRLGDSWTTSVATSSRCSGEAWIGTMTVPSEIFSRLAFDGSLDQVVARSRVIIVCVHPMSAVQITAMWLYPAYRRTTPLIAWNGSKSSTSPSSSTA
mmetsp:Transcript_55058/g.130682  ORF Transcript_55058/g.130682 Transcript_55058/m.130682 type:complete len:226 (-) Transcript_55058:1361-2038(-)